VAASQALREVREDDRTSLGWHRGPLRVENKVALGFVEGLNNKVRVIQRRAYGLRDEEYLRLKILTCMLPAL
jgi:transposase